MRWHGYIKADGTCLLTPLFPVDQVVINWIAGEGAAFVSDFTGGMQATAEMAKEYGAKRFILHDPPNIDMKPMPDLPTQ
jgi:hypothetical protein